MYSPKKVPPLFAEVRYGHLASSFSFQASGQLCGGFTAWLIVVHRNDDLVVRFEALLLGFRHGSADERRALLVMLKEMRLSAGIRGSA
jgi:hypothetical protein